MMQRFCLPLVALLLLLASCGGSGEQQQAEQMLAQANTLYEQGLYAEARACIDSLRRIHPNAINTRKKALKLQQEIELARAQGELLVADSLLQLAQHDLSYQQTKVDRDKAALTATAEELTMLTQTRMRRDSLRTLCEALTAKIRYIHKKQKE